MNRQTRGKVSLSQVCQCMSSTPATALQETARELKKSASSSKIQLCPMFSHAHLPSPLVITSWHHMCHLPVTKLLKKKCLPNHLPNQEMGKSWTAEQKVFCKTANLSLLF